MMVFRPAKRHFEVSGFTYLSGGYRWYWLKKSDSLEKKSPDAFLRWVEDGDRIYYRCPNCKKITESYCRKDGDSDSIINGRELDTIRCEACSKCFTHHWMTFEDAVSRKTAGAIRLRPRKCPVCKKSETTFWRGMETSIIVMSFNVELVTCAMCSRRWRIESLLKEKAHG